MSSYVANVGVVPGELIDSFEKWLKPYGVDWPNPGHELGLVLLYQNLGHPVSQKDLIAFYRNYGQDYNRQLRHIAASGWHVASGNVRSTRMHHDPSMANDELKLVSVTSPGPIWLGDKRLTREGRAGATCWDDMLRLYASHGCAVCGQKAAHYDRGHLDPNKPADLSNIVPMCVECNNYAQSRDIHYELHGLVARPVRMRPQTIV